MAATTFGAHDYPRTHFAYKIETPEDPNWILTIRRDAIVAVAILVPEDQRGWRVIVKLVDLQDPTKAWNREWTRGETSCVMDFASLIHGVYTKLGLVPQLRYDGLLAIEVVDDRITYGSPQEPHRLFVHIIGRQLVDLGLKWPFIDPGRQFTLANHFQPWEPEKMVEVASFIRDHISHNLDTYGLLIYDGQKVKLLKSIDNITFEKDEKNYHVIQRNVDGSIVWKSESPVYPYVLSPHQRAQPCGISDQAFQEWHQREIDRNNVLYTHANFVIWRDLKQRENNSIYWVLWFTDPTLITVHNLHPQHAPLLREARDCIMALLTKYAQDHHFTLIIHDPPSIGRLHIQVIPTLASLHHCGMEQLYTMAHFTVTLDRVISSLESGFQSPKHTQINPICDSP